MNLIEIFRDKWRKKQTQALSVCPPHLSHQARLGLDKPFQKLNLPSVVRSISLAQDGNPEALIALFERMLLEDPHLDGEMQKRIRASSALPWVIVPPRQPNANTEAMMALVQKQMLHLPIKRLLEHLNSAIAFGFGASELVWKLHNSSLMVESVRLLPHRDFTLEQGEIALRPKPCESKQEAPLLLSEKPLKWILHQHRTNAGSNPCEHSLLRRLILSYLFKFHTFLDAANFLEIYGTPMRLGRYPSGMGKAAREELMRAVAQIGQDSSGVISDLMQIEFIDLAKGRDINHYLQFVETIDRLQTKTILGATLTSESGKSGSYALASVHRDIRDEIFESDCENLLATLNTQLIMPLLSLNFHEALPENMPTLQWVMPPKNLSEKLDCLQKAQKLGMRITEDYAHEMTGMPQASNSEATLSPL